MTLCFSFWEVHGSFSRVAFSKVLHLIRYIVPFTEIHILMLALKFIWYASDCPEKTSHVVIT